MSKNLWFLGYQPSQRHVKTIKLCLTELSKLKFKCYIKRNYIFLGNFISVVKKIRQFQFMVVYKSTRLLKDSTWPGARVLKKNWCPSPNKPTQLSLVNRIIMTKSSIITTCRRPASGVIPFSDFRGVKRLDVVVGSSVDQPTGVDDVHAETSGGFPLQLARNGGLLRYHRARGNIEGDTCHRIHRTELQ